MKPDKPKPVRCVCKRFPLCAPGKKIRCITPSCLFRGRKFESVEEWSEFQEVRVVNAAVNVCREMGLV